MDRWVAIALLLCGVVGTILAQSDKDCPPCDLNICDKPVGCEAGITKDRCGCCEVCAQTEGALCDHADIPTKEYHGRCGDNLECRIRNDVGRKQIREAVCMCTMNDYLCGSDGNTYVNLCRVVAQAVATQTKIKVEHKGACKSAPMIVSPPENQRNLTGDNVVLSCEVKGFPIPSVEWYYKRGNDIEVSLPSDDEHISVNSRGGPEKYEVTGWVQIIDVQSYHQGDYFCKAKNALGEAEEHARVSIYKPGDERY